MHVGLFVCMYLGLLGGLIWLCILRACQYAYMHNCRIIYAGRYACMYSGLLGGL